MLEGTACRPIVEAMEDSLQVCKGGFDHDFSPSFLIRGSEGGLTQTLVGILRSGSSPGPVVEEGLTHLTVGALGVVLTVTH